MGVIEESIFIIYRKALEEGNFEQAKKAVELATFLKQKVETEGFIDYSADRKEHSLYGNFFEPFPYRYYPEKGVVVIGNSAIHLTESENKLFFLFSTRESSGNNIQIITNEDVRIHLWGDRVVTKNAVRIIILRLRAKIEANEKKPQLLVNIYDKGYVFFGKRVKDKE